MKRMIGSWVLRHLQVFFETIGRLWRKPLENLAAMLVIAIAVSLPLVLNQIIISVDQLSSGWNQAPQISVFLKSDVDGEAVAPVTAGESLLRNPMVEDVKYVSPEQGLTEFSGLSGFEEAIKALPENPLPPLLVVFPATGQDHLASAELADTLSALPFVDTAIYDQQWLFRLRAMIEVVERVVLVLAILMGVGILLLIGNTIRLGITNRSAEIEIIDQVGGTHAFIRRPFLYIGALQCFGGALLAWLITSVTIKLLAEPVNRLASLYQSNFSISYVAPEVVAGVFFAVTLLGILAAGYTVNQHLRQIKPS